jgi:hypothetical protein
MVFDPAYIQALDHLTLSTLRHFECYLTLTNSLISFLNRHPTISYLQIAPTEAFALPSPAGATSPPAPPPSIVLPQLQYFSGNSQCISALTCDTALRAAFVFWDAVDAAPQDAITALERTSSETMNVLSCRRRGWNLDLLDLISIWLPNIYMLSLTNLLVVDAHPSTVSEITLLMRIVAYTANQGISGRSQGLLTKVYRASTLAHQLRRCVEDG